MKVLIFGKGQMGTMLLDYFKNAYLSSCDITKIKEIEKEIKKFKPDVIINTAAMTSLEECEENKLKAFKVNSLAPYEIAKICQKYKIYFVQFSSGCIFSSKSKKDVYKEDDRPNPESYYSLTKVFMEDLLKDLKNILIIRPRVPISSAISPRNTLLKLLTYQYFIKDQNTLSVLEDIFPGLKKMIEKKVTGIYHLANPGTISPYEIALLLKKYINPKTIIKKTTQKKLNQKLYVKRVSTILSLRKLSKIGIKLPDIRKRILKIILKFKKNLEKAGGLEVISKIKKETSKKFKYVNP